MKILKVTLLSMVLILAMWVSGLYAAENSSEKGAVVIDVRTEAEWLAGHLEGAVLIPYERIGDEIAKVVADKNGQVYLYCRSGRRTGIAMGILKKAGYENVINLETVENASKVLNRAVVK